MNLENLGTKEQKKYRKSFNGYVWEKARYMAYNDFLTINPKSRYPGGFFLYKYGAVFGSMGHFCTKLDIYYTKEELYGMFLAVKELYNMPLDELVRQVKKHSPFHEESIDKVMRRI